jgi:hypothetical protein
MLIRSQLFAFYVAPHPFIGVGLGSGLFVPKSNSVSLLGVRNHPSGINNKLFNR